MEIHARETECKDAATPQEGVSTLRERFELRVWAGAHLCAEGEIDLQDAVDVLQAWAEQIGLVDALGQDGVQAIIAAAFGGADA